MNRPHPGANASRPKPATDHPAQTAGSDTLRGRPRPGIRLSAVPGGSTGRPGHGTGLARAITELLAPANLAVAQLLLVGWHSTPGPAGLGWGLLAATFCGLLPYGIVIAGVRRRRWTDRHLRVRQQRQVPLLAAIVLVVAGLVALVVLDAPRELVALVAAMLTGLAATLVVTLWWKLSLHTAAASGTVAILALTFGPALILILPTVAAVAWSRVRLGDHTPAQTLAGAALGALVATTVFILLR
jgi:membrane-associated phospholipid phosphatase